MSFSVVAPPLEPTVFDYTNAGIINWYVNKKKDVLVLVIFVVPVSKGVLPTGHTICSFRA
jgi:hypothetical protein